jgi:hypothetical protein
MTLSPFTFSESVSVCLSVPYFGNRSESVSAPWHNERPASSEIISRIYPVLHVTLNKPSLWSSGQSSWLQNLRSRVRFPAPLDFLSSSGSGMGPTQPRGYICGNSIWKSSEWVKHQTLLSPQRWLQYVIPKRRRCCTT